MPSSPPLYFPIISDDFLPPVLHRVLNEIDIYKNVKNDPLVFFFLTVEIDKNQVHFQFYQSLYSIFPGLPMHTIYVQLYLYVVSLCVL